MIKIYDKYGEGIEGLKVGQVWLSCYDGDSQWRLSRVLTGIKAGTYQLHMNPFLFRTVTRIMITDKGLIYAHMTANHNISADKFSKYSNKIKIRFSLNKTTPLRGKILFQDIDIYSCPICEKEYYDEEDYLCEGCRA